LHSKASGKGWDYKYKTSVDGNGNPISYLSIENWEKKEEPTNDITRFGLGFRAGLGFSVALNKQFGILVNGSYSTCLNNALKLEGVAYTNIHDIAVTVGVSYRFEKQILIFKKKSME
jgi:opacity protein-like surface antigen